MRPGVRGLTAACSVNAYNTRREKRRICVATSKSEGARMNTLRTRGHRCAARCNTLRIAMKRKGHEQRRKYVRSRKPGDNTPSNSVGLQDAGNLEEERPRSSPGVGCGIQIRSRRSDSRAFELRIHPQDMRVLGTESLEVSNPDAHLYSG